MQSFLPSLVSANLPALILSESIIDMIELQGGCCLRIPLWSEVVGVSALPSSVPLL